MGISAEESEQVRSGAVGLAPPRAGGRIPSIPDGAESDGPAEGSPAPPAEPAFGASQRELGVVFSAPPSGAGPHRNALQMPRLQRLALYSADWGKIVALGPFVKRALDTARRCALYVDRWWRQGGRERLQTRPSASLCLHRGHLVPDFPCDQISFRLFQNKILSQEVFIWNLYQWKYSFCLTEILHIHNYRSLAFIVT